MCFLVAVTEPSGFASINVPFQTANRHVVTNVKKPAEMFALSECTQIAVIMAAQCCYKLSMFFQQVCWKKTAGNLQQGIMRLLLRNISGCTREALHVDVDSLLARTTCRNIENYYSSIWTLYHDFGCNTFRTVLYFTTYLGR